MAWLAFSRSTNANLTAGSAPSPARRRPRLLSRSRAPPARRALPAAAGVPPLSPRWSDHPRVGPRQCPLAAPTPAASPSRPPAAGQSPQPASHCSALSESPRRETPPDRADDSCSYGHLLSLLITKRTGVHSTGVTPASQARRRVLEGEQVPA